MLDTITSNPLIDKLPPHLKQFIKPQNYEEYTPIDQAVWRYVMKRNLQNLPKNAHESYLTGLKKTGISIDKIPNMYGMNRILKEIGWAAVAVDGFIPPNAFMEFQAYNILVIASDIRQLDHIEYTPAPDIIHEAAGHAPIIANPDYAEYLRRFGKIGCKAISSKKDHDMYQAVRRLSILKEASGSSLYEIEKSEKEIERLQNIAEPPSEMAQIRNLHWWTVEYGLIGTVESPKIYGAGLLSSIGESEWCITDKVKKLDYSPEAAYKDFDITKPQPQLYVTPDFAYLCQVLEEFADTMALRTGGYKGLAKLIESQNLGTIELSTGSQISGIFSKMLQNEDRKVIYFETEGETALSFRDKELVGHGIHSYPKGFGSPLGKLKGSNLAIEDMTPRDLSAYDFYEGTYIEFEFESGIHIAGTIVTGTRSVSGKLLLIRFSECTVTYENEILYDPSRGHYVMAVGTKIISAYAGPADDYSFDLVTHTLESEGSKTEHDSELKELHALYASVRNIREGKHTTFSLEAVFDILKSDYPNDWLLPVEIYELVYGDSNDFAVKVRNYLEELQTRLSKKAHLIQSGIEMQCEKVIS